MDWRNRSGLALAFLILVGLFVIIVVIGGVSYFVYKDSKSIVPVPPVACHCPDMCFSAPEFPPRGSWTSSSTRGPTSP